MFSSFHTPESKMMNTHTRIESPHSSLLIALNCSLAARQRVPGSAVHPRWAQLPAGQRQEGGHLPRRLESDRAPSREQENALHLFSGSTRHGASLFFIFTFIETKRSKPKVEHLAPVLLLYYIF